MPQGKIKVKSKGAAKPAQKSKPVKQFHGVKKGVFKIAPKKQVWVSVYINLCSSIGSFL